MEKVKDYSASYQAISASLKYRTLISRRARFSLVLTAIVLITYYAYMLVVAFRPSWLGIPLGEGGAVSIGWPIGAAMVIGYWLLTGIYVRRANDEFETLSKDLIKEFGR
jgi:uncharacterized membrane protein (DUF485 family)